MLMKEINGTAYRGLLFQCILLTIELEMNDLHNLQSFS